MILKYEYSQKKLNVSFIIGNHVDFQKPSEIIGCDMYENIIRPDRVLTIIIINGRLEPSNYVLSQPVVNMLAM